MSASWLVGRLYLAAAIACALGEAPVSSLTPEAGTEPAGPRGPWVLIGSALGVLVVACGGLRWAAAGHLRCLGPIESGLSLAAAIMVASWLWEARGRFRTGAGPFAC